MIKTRYLINADNSRKIQAINKYIHDSRKLSTKHKSKFSIMEHLKTLRSYLTNGNGASSTTVTEKKEEDFEASTTADQLGQVPCNTEAGSLPNNNGTSKIPRFPNFLSFRSQSEKHMDHSSTQRTKFIKTANATRQARKSLDKVNSSPVSFDRNLKGGDPSKLFTVLDNEYDKLIKHFELVISQSGAAETPATTNTPQSTAQNNILEMSDVSPHAYLNLSRHGKELLRRCVSNYNNILDLAPEYDFDSEQMPANGYRSLNQVFENCCRRLISVTRDLNDKKKSIFFVFKFNLPASLSTILKDFQIWLRIMEKIEFLLKIALDMQELKVKENTGGETSTADGLREFDLFVHNKQMADSTIERDLFQSSVVDLECFFGRACGFQFCDSLAIPLTGVSIAFASYNDGYHASSKKETQQSSPVSVSASSSTGSNTLQQAQTTSTTPSSEITTPTSSASSYAAAISLGLAAKSLFSSTKYIMDPELRAKKVTQVFKNANVEFCKAFWQLTETSIVQMGTNMIMPTIALNTVKKINFNTLKLPRVGGKVADSIDDSETEYVEIIPPTGCTASDSVQIRIMSTEIRDGMKDLDKLQPNDLPPPTSSSETFNQAYMTNFMNGQTTSSPKSSCLILHAHGGGFIAHSSKSHEIYLRPWCKELKVPIVSIDYSLAPEYPFPRASEECFYVYAWCLQNKNLLGWTGEKIICVGDSAGGVLVTNIVQRAINSQIRVPDALVPIYTPFLLTYSISPSRLLSVIDPVLNIAILWRCLAAYCGVDFKSETERLKKELNLDSSPSSGSPSSPSTPTTNKTFFNRLSMKYFKDSLNTNSNGSTKSHKKSSSVDEKSQKPVSFDTLDAKFIDESPEKENEEIERAQSVSSSNQASSEVSLNVEPEDNINKSQSSADQEEDKKRIKELYNLMGDSVFLIEKLRNHPAPRNPYMSPLLSSDELLSKFPKTYLITASHDPLLDDNVEMGKRLKSLNVTCSMYAINGLHHGFLNFININKESQRAAKQVTNLLKAEMAMKS